MADTIKVPKDTPDWQSILSDVESAESSAKTARDDAQQAVTDISELGGIDGTVQSFGDLPSAGSNSGEFWYVVDEHVYYKSDGSSWNQNLTPPGEPLFEDRIVSHADGDFAIFDPKNYATVSDAINAAATRASNSGGGRVVIGEEVPPSDASSVTVPSDVDIVRPHLPERRFPSGQQEIIAHRGFKAIAPENTVVAASLALRYGADSLEFDVHISSDGEPVVIHDSTVDRTTDGSGDVSNKTLADLKSLDAGSWFDSVYAGAEIPTLGEMLDVAVQGNFRRLFIELKAGSQSDVVNVVDEVKARGLEDNAVIQSPNFSRALNARPESNRVGLGFTAGSLTEAQDAISRAKIDHRSVLVVDNSVIRNNPSVVDDARRFGITVAAYTVNDSETVQKVISTANVNSIITDKLTARIQ